LGVGVVAVADAGPIIHLYEIGLLGLLDIWEQVIVPGAVWTETITAGRLPKEALEELNAFRLVQSSQPEIEQFIQRFNLGALHAGEQECLFVCKQEVIPLFLTDDLAARKRAKQLGIQPVGSVGIIVRAYRIGQLSLLETEEHLRSLQQTSSLFVTPEIIELAIRQLS
jgi:predicted nucleic acid-binding protein